MDIYKVLHYVDESGNDLYQDWMARLRDQVAKVAVVRRVARVAVGNFGELRIDVGPGYRVYYAQVGDKVVLLTHAGDRRSQASDIAKAIKLFKNWEKRNETRP